MRYRSMVHKSESFTALWGIGCVLSSSGKKNETNGWTSGEGIAAGMRSVIPYSRKILHWPTVRAVRGSRVITTRYMHSGPVSCCPHQHLYLHLEGHAKQQRPRAVACALSAPVFVLVALLAAGMDVAVCFVNKGRASCSTARLATRGSRSARSALAANGWTARSRKRSPSRAPARMRASTSSIVGCPTPRAAPTWATRFRSSAVASAGLSKGTSAPRGRASNTCARATSTRSSPPSRTCFSASIPTTWTSA